MWIFFSIISRSLAAVCAKKAGIASAGHDALALVFNPWFVAEIAFLFVQAVCWTRVLRHRPLHVAYPFMSLVIGCNLLMCRFLFSEPIHSQHIAGGVVIIFGVWITTRNEHGQA